MRAARVDRATQRGGCSRETAMALETTRRACRSGDARRARARCSDGGHIRAAADAGGGRAARERRGRGSAPARAAVAIEVPSMGESITEETIASLEKGAGESGGSRRAHPRDRDRQGFGRGARAARRRRHAAPRRRRRGRPGRRAALHARSRRGAVRGIGTLGRGRGRARARRRAAAAPAAARARARARRAAGGGRGAARGRGAAGRAQGRAVVPERHELGLRRRDVRQVAGGPDVRARVCGTRTSRRSTRASRARRSTRTTRRRRCRPTARPRSRRARAARRGGEPRHGARAQPHRGVPAAPHENAGLDPLGLWRQGQQLADLDYKTYGFAEADLDRRVSLAPAGAVGAVSGLMNNADFNGDGETTLRELLTFLEQTYCGTIGVECEHITDLEKLNWIRERVEVHPPPMAKETKHQLLERLAFSEKFEAVLAVKFNSAKRFGLEGCESMIPGLKAMVDEATTPASRTCASAWRTAAAQRAEQRDPQADGDDLQGVPRHRARDGRGGPRRRQLDAERRRQVPGSAPSSTARTPTGAPCTWRCCPTRRTSRRSTRSSSASAARRWTSRATRPAAR